MVCRQVTQTIKYKPRAVWLKTCTWYASTIGFAHDTLMMYRVIPLRPTCLWKFMETRSEWLSIFYPAHDNEGMQIPPWFFCEQLHSVTHTAQWCLRETQRMSPSNKWVTEADGSRSETSRWPDNFISHPKSHCLVGFFWNHWKPRSQGKFWTLLCIL